MLYVQIFWGKKWALVSKCFIQMLNVEKGCLWSRRKKEGDYYVRTTQMDFPIDGRLRLYCDSQEFSPTVVRLRIKFNWNEHYEKLTETMLDRMIQLNQQWRWVSFAYEQSDWHMPYVFTCRGDVNVSSLDSFNAVKLLLKYCHRMLAIVKKVEEDKGHG